MIGVLLVYNLQCATFEYVFTNVCCLLIDTADTFQIANIERIGLVAKIELMRNTEARVSFKGKFNGT
ncbi:hypothetical protein X965_13150 [Morganella sp. EGD-HP17]|nr:hypothetical protein X965_13150 [Morganella sp. EGD-HP17]